MTAAGATIQVMVDHDERVDRGGPLGVSTFWLLTQVDYMLIVVPMLWVWPHFCEPLNVTLHADQVFGTALWTFGHPDGDLLPCRTATGARTIRTSSYRKEPSHEGQSR
jgi:hypothetical protein